MKLAIGSDHAGYPLKVQLLDVLRRKGHEIQDYGSYDEKPVDFPDIAKKVTAAILSGEAERGIMFCGTGVGAAIACNKVRGIRASVCHDLYTAHQCVEHDDVQIIALGAQIVGYEGVDKRIDVLATAIRTGLKATELKDLDLAYAPPYSSAKDPVNMAGFMAENIADGLVKQFHYEDIADLRCRENVILLDTRTPAEYARGHAEGFRNIPLDDLRERLAELDITKPVYVMCQSGLRSYIACRILTQNGYECYNFSGGYRFYQSIHAEKQVSSSAYPCGMDKEYAAIR